MHHRQGMMRATGKPLLHRWALALAIAATAAACAAGSVPATARAADADRPLVVMLDSEPATLNPFLATDAYGVRISHQLIYETLVTLGDDLQVAPGVAQRWKRLSPTHYRFTVRKGARFENGATLQAADVVYTLRTFMAPETGSPYGAGLREKIAQVRATGPLTFEVTLKAPYAGFLADLILPVVARGTPPHVGDGALNGSGPFRLAGRSVGEIDLARNPDYHGAPAGVSRVAFKVVKDESTRLLKFRKGDIDLGINVLPLDKLAHFASGPLKARYRVAEGPGLSFQYLGFNLSDPVLGKVQVRRALAYAIDVNALVVHRQFGHSTRATGLFPPGSPYTDPQVKPIPYDPAKAAALLDAAGYPLKGGRRFSLEYKTTTDRSAVIQARIIANDLRKVGVHVDVRSYEWGTFYQDIRRGNFQMYSLRWIGVFDPGFLYELFDSARVPPHGRNRGRYRSARMDALLEKARTEPDPARRSALYRQVHRLLAEDLPILPLWHNHNVAVVSRALAGFRLSPSGGFEHLAQVHWAAAAH